MFGELYANNPERFQFGPDDMKLIKQVVNHVKIIVDGNGTNSGLDHFSATKSEPKEFSCHDQATKSESQTHHLLRKLLSAADRNIERKKGGYRYDADVKLYAAYLRMLIGPMAYETLQKNLECSLPSLPSKKPIYFLVRMSNRGRHIKM